MLEDQLNFQTLYGSAKDGVVLDRLQKPTEDITALLDAIIEEIPHQK